MENRFKTFTLAEKTTLVEALIRFRDNLNKDINQFPEYEPEYSAGVRACSRLVDEINKSSR